MAAKKKSAMDKTVTKAQRVLSGYLKSGRKSAQATVDELARLFGSATSAVTGAGRGKKTTRKTAKRKTTTRKTTKRAGTTKRAAAATKRGGAKRAKSGSRAGIRRATKRGRK